MILLRGRRPKRSSHDATPTTTQPLTGLQGQGRPGGDQGRAADHRPGRALRRPSQPDHQVEAPAAGRRARGLRRGQAERRPRTEHRGAARQDRRADHGERFFIGGARAHAPSERKAMIDRSHPLPISRQALLLGLARSTVYYEPAPVSERDLAIMAAIDAIHTELPFYGIRRIRDELRARGFAVGRQHVATLMRTMGISAIAPRRRLSKPAPGHKIYPYLLRNLQITTANHV
ncbi:MAG: transposase, partial [Chloroflexi bacterium]|nr:transposase [Chloroflexota bacterium]